MAQSPAKQVRRFYRGEEEWFPLLKEFGFPKLRNAFIKCGVSPQTAMGLVFFISDQKDLDRHQDGATRVRYRRILRDLDPDEVADLIRDPDQSFPRYLNSVAA